MCRRKASTAPAVGLVRRGRDHSSRSEGAHAVAADEAGSPASYTQPPNAPTPRRDAADSGAWPGSRRELPGAHRPEVLGLHRLHCEETIAGAVSKPTVQAVAHDDLVGLRDAAKTSGEVDRVADDADMCD